MLRIGSSLNFPFRDTMCNVSVMVSTSRSTLCDGLSGAKVRSETSRHALPFGQNPLLR